MAGMGKRTAFHAPLGGASPSHRRHSGGSMDTAEAADAACVEPPHQPAGHFLHEVHLSQQASGGMQLYTGFPHPAAFSQQPPGAGAGGGFGGHFSGGQQRS